MRPAGANAIVLAALAAACGGKAAPATTGGNPGGETPGPAGPSVWSALTPGATWTLESSYSSEDEPVQTLTATVSSVETIGGRSRIALAWTFFDGTEGAPFEGAVPAEIVVGDGGVWLIGGDDYTDADADAPARHAEPPVAEERADGRYTRLSDVAGESIACFGAQVVMDPDEEIGCGSDCNAHLCVGAKSGIVAVSGTWAPEGGDYRARGFDDLGQDPSAGPF